MFLRRRSAAKNLVPRARCQYIRLELPTNLSKSQAAQSIRLQLQRLEGSSAVSFAWRLPAPQSKAYPIWFWKGDPAARAECPEPLLIQSLDVDGPAARRCQQGFELTFHAGSELVKTRWLSSPLGEDEWQRWLDECGVVAPEQSKAHVRSGTQLTRPATGWHFDRVAIEDKWSRSRWKQLATIAAVSSVVGAGVTLSVNLFREVKSIEQSLSELESTSGEAAELQRQVDRSLGELQKISALAPNSTQTEALARVATLKQLGAVDQAALVEWDVRGEGLRMQIVRPKGEYRLNDLLESLETKAGLKNIRLMPNPPAGMIVIQAQIK